MNHLKNFWSATLVIISIIFCLTALNSCQRPENKWRYEIHGYVIKDGEQHKAIWYTDTLEIGDNYLRYENSDGSEVIIPAPFVLIDHQYDKHDTNFRNPFK